MENKKLVVTIHRKDNSSVYGVITPEIMEYVCQETGLNKEQFIDSLGKLENLGVLESEYAVMH